MLPAHSVVLENEFPTQVFEGFEEFFWLFKILTEDCEAAENQEKTRLFHPGDIIQRTIELKNAFITLH